MARHNPPAAGSQHFEQGTWLEPESLCYPNGSFTRRARAMLNGKPRIFKAGLCDTFFSIPVKGHDGYLSIQDGVLVFSRHTRTKQAGDNTQCPTDYKDVRGQAGCGSTDVSAPDEDGYRFCNACGIFFEDTAGDRTEAPQSLFPSHLKPLRQEGRHAQA